jgi:hypothetical protein
MPKIILESKRDRIESSILLIRGQRVILDSDLANLYGVSIKRLNEQVKRNLRRFPTDFMFQLTRKETSSLRSQFATLKTKGRGKHRKYLPHVFTEQGIAMLSGVLNSRRAIDVNIAIMRGFVKIREILSNHKELAQQLERLDHKIEKHDVEIQTIFSAIKQLMRPPDRPNRKIGFHP